MVTIVTRCFATVNGTNGLDDADPPRASVAVEIDTSNVETRVAERDKHVRSTELFDGEKSPPTTFQSRRAKPAQGSHYGLIGVLTTRDVIQDAAFDTTAAGRTKEHRGSD